MGKQSIIYHYYIIFSLHLILKIENLTLIKLPNKGIDSYLSQMQYKLLLIELLSKTQLRLHTKFLERKRRKQFKSNEGKSRRQRKNTKNASKRNK